VKSLRFLTVFLAACVLVALPFAARAEDITAERAQLISSHCKALHMLIDQLQRRDLVSRTNLGREYESVDKQLSAFNQRIHNNNINNQAYTQLLTQFRDATTQFRDTYVHYDDSINKLQAIDCQAHTADFDAQLTVTRSLRDATEGTITHAAALVGQYRDLAVQLPSQLPTQAGSEANP
jgi:hypothetical protein